MVGPSAAQSSAAEGAPTAEARATGGRWVEGTFAGTAGSRRYQVYVPGSYDATRRHMLVVLLHGCTQDAGDIARGTRIAEHADRDGFLVLLPEQPESANAKRCWNWYDPAHQVRDAGEPSLIAGMTARVAEEYAVDPARVHLAGISAGAAMASLVAVAYPERYASLALHSGLAWRAATSVVSPPTTMTKGTEDADALGVAALEAMGTRARAIPTLVLHGGKDAVVNAANGRQAARQWMVTNSRALGVDSLSPVRTSGRDGGYGWTRACYRTGSSCIVEEIVVDELGHAWSGGSREGTFTDENGLAATGELIRFFRDHPMPAAL
jgi:poly(hydroxyalkanoate) depolymerase family esterase